MRSSPEFRALVFARIQEWLAGGAHGACPLHELAHDETAEQCCVCGGDAGKCAHKEDNFDDWRIS